MGVAGDIHQQVAEQPVHQPGRAGLVRGRLPVQFSKSDFQFIQAVMAGFIDTRLLAGGSDKKT